MGMDRVQGPPLVEVSDEPENVREALEDLIQVLADGRIGYEHAADKLEDPKFVETFQELGRKRGELLTELVNIGARYDVDPDTDGSIEAAMHRAWISLKSAFTANDDHAIIAAAEEGEDHALEAFAKALESDFTPDVESVIRRAYVGVKEGHDQLKALKDLTE